MLKQLTFNPNVPVIKTKKPQVELKIGITKQDVEAEGWVPHKLEYLSNVVWMKGSYQIAFHRNGELWVHKWEEEGNMRTPVSKFKGKCENMDDFKKIIELVWYK